MAKKYDASDIVVLEGIEPVRRRPAMYIGGTDINALHNLVYEVVDNSIDEVMAGYATTITVEVQADGSFKHPDSGNSPGSQTVSIHPLVYLEGTPHGRLGTHGRSGRPDARLCC